MSKFNNRETTYHVAQVRKDNNGEVESVLVIDTYSKALRYTDRLSDSYEYSDRAAAQRVATYLNRIMKETGFDNVYYYVVTNDQNKTITVNENDVPDSLKEFFGIEDKEPEEDEETADENDEEEPAE